MTDLEYTIQKGIPYGGRGKWKLLATKMEVGDSVLVESSHKSIALTVALKKLGYQVATRVEGTGVRVWKCELKIK